MHDNLKITYKNNKPYGIREEVQEQYALADFLLSALGGRVK